VFAVIHLDILRDNREQKGWDFENFPVTVHDETINTGDYTLAELCRHDSEKDTYYPRYAVERKAGQDFVSSITSGRDRFREEIKRTSDWDSELLVLIEEPRRTFKRQEGFMRYRDVTWPQISGTVEKWERYYNVDFNFVGTRERAQQKAFDALGAKLRATLVSD
jgi:ERCC4-type nuclease